MPIRMLLFILFVSFSTTTIFAQKDKNKDNDTVIIDFGEDNDPDDSYGSASGFILKTSPFTYLSGSQAFELEKAITGFLSLQAGFGLTFKPLLGDLLSELQTEFSNIDGCDSDQWENDICDDYFDVSIRRYKPGIVLNASPRLFFGDDSPEGGYFGLNVKYAIFNVEVQKIEEGSSLDRLENDWQAEKIRNFDLTGQYGYQWLFDHLTFEYFLGLGIRFKKETRQDIGTNSSNNFRNGERTFEGQQVRFETGVRIGFQL